MKLLIGILAILSGWWPMADHYFKRELRVPHYDAAGEEVIVEGEYILEWMIRNSVTNPSFENGTGSPAVVDSWTVTPANPSCDLRRVSTNPRTGTCCCNIYDANAGGWPSGDGIWINNFVSEPIPLSKMAYTTGFIGEIHFRKNTGSSLILNASVSIRLGDVVDDEFVSSEVFAGTAASIPSTACPANEWHRLFVEVLPSQLTTYYPYAQLYIYVGIIQNATDGTCLFDDAAFHLRNEHNETDYDDFAALNVEDYETFHFGSDYDLTDSGGALLLGSSPYGSDDPVSVTTMADGSPETTLIRSPMDAITLVFRLFSRAQVLKLRQWHKHTRGLPFIWVDDFGVEREVKWIGNYVPESEGTHETWTVTINLIPTAVDAGGI